MGDNVNRRQFILGVTASLGAAMTPLGAKALETAASTVGLNQTGILSTSQLKVVEVAADIIIPSTDTPGAAKAGVHHFINRMVSFVLSEQQRIEFLKGLDGLANSQGGFSALSRQQQTELLTARDKNRHSDEFFRGFKEAVVYGYYTSEVGASQELNYDPVPGPYKEIPFSDVGKIWS